MLYPHDSQLPKSYLGPAESYYVKRGAETESLTPAASPVKLKTADRCFVR
ncbi:hypothetical protein HPL003_21335 [Paenibacillus terrae HPL-003]|uniref:Uncharacterized protein n=1 Tax=Paenibacillus terrae (strain HPL-003) TaxID=985665 RepID=G7VPJ9_PAETH|nr:hypothetical protein HPL003_21335 [Paenibacillus terrae HPL-003]